jgi:mannose-6-phosphate isomerase-like protein (cupin superfamily)
MAQVIHPRDPRTIGMSIEEIAARYTARFLDRQADWDAFADARLEGYRRAQHRFIGGGGSGKHDDPNTIPAGAFTLSIMYVEPGQGNAPHTHEAEEVFFVLKGYLTVFFEDETGRRVNVRLGPWDCVSCPAGVIHGYQNESLEPVYFQVMIGRGRPDLMGYTDPSLLAQRDVHLREPQA